mmetsp:Transcript_15232/g.53513  ORF Transcript_15232/g.53513 Transcript_15232/m.53513 type:complete len:352 (+) Transcript_15232:113-1168(+)
MKSGRILPSCRLQGLHTAPHAAVRIACLMLLAATHATAVATAAVGGGGGDVDAPLGGAVRDLSCRQGSDGLDWMLVQDMVQRLLFRGESKLHHHIFDYTWLPEFLSCELGVVAFIVCHIRPPLLRNLPLHLRAVHPQAARLERHRGQRLGLGLVRPLGRLVWGGLRPGRPTSRRLRHRRAARRLERCSLRGRRARPGPKCLRGGGGALVGQGGGSSLACGSGGPGLGARRGSRAAPGVASRRPSLRAWRVRPAAARLCVGQFVADSQANLRRAASCGGANGESARFIRRGFSAGPGAEAAEAAFRCRRQARLQRDGEVGPCFACSCPAAGERLLVVTRRRRVWHRRVDGHL